MECWCCCLLCYFTREIVLWSAVVFVFCVILLEKLCNGVLMLLLYCVLFLEKCFLLFSSSNKFWNSSEWENELEDIFRERFYETRLGDLLHFGQLFKACGNNCFAQINIIFRLFLLSCQNVSFYSLNHLAIFYCSHL